MKFDTAKLKDEKSCESFRQKLKNILHKTPQSATEVEEEWGLCKNAVLEVAEETLGHKENIRNEWFDEECMAATKKKNEAYKRTIQCRRTRASEEEYKYLRRIEKRLRKKKKKEYLEKTMIEMEEHLRQGNTYLSYKITNELRKSFKPRVTACRDRNGNLLSDQETILERWREHFEELYNSQESEMEEADPTLIPDEMIPTAEATQEEITTEEVRQALQKLKNNKAAGIDNIPAELWKQGEETAAERICNLISKIWKDAKMPKEWNMGIITPLHKKAMHYRGVTLLNASYKVLSNVLCARIKPYAEQILGGYQCGFRPNKSTTDQICAIRVVLEKTLEYNITTHHIFVDFKNAYDSIKRNVLYTAMVEFGIPMHLVRMVKMTLESVECRVKIQNELSAPFTSRRGLRQGDALSCILFNLALEKVIRLSGIDVSGTIMNKSVQILAYADDINIIGRSVLSAKEAFVAIEKAAKTIGLRINEGKTKYMRVSASESNQRQNLTIDEYNIEAVSEFKYLGSNVNCRNDISYEIRARITSANKAYYGLLRQLNSRYIKRSTKLRLYKTLIRPVLTFSSETWTMTNRDEQMLNTFERKVLRKIFGPICENGEWRSRYNQELYELYDDLNVVDTIKCGRLRWIAHVVRLQESNPVRRLVFYRMDGKRRRGRPKKRYLEDIEEDIKRAGVQDWKSKAMDREAWKRILQEVVARKGL